MNSQEPQRGRPAMPDRKKLRKRFFRINERDTKFLRIADDDWSAFEGLISDGNRSRVIRGMILEYISRHGKES